MNLDNRVQQLELDPEQKLIQISNEAQTKRHEVHSLMLDTFRTDEGSDYDKNQEFSHFDETIDLLGTRVRLYTKFREINGERTFELVAENLDIPPTRNIKLTGGYTVNTPVLFSDAIFRTLQGDRIIFTNLYEAGGGSFEDKVANPKHRFDIMRDLIKNSALHLQAILSDPDYGGLPTELWGNSMGAIEHDQALREPNLLPDEFLKRISGVRKISGAASGALPFRVGPHLAKLTWNTLIGGNISDAFGQSNLFSAKTTKSAFMTGANQEAIFEYLQTRFKSAGIFFSYSTRNVPAASRIDSTRLQLLKTIPRTFVLTRSDPTINNNAIKTEMRQLASQGIPVSSYTRELYPETHLPESCHTSLKEAAESIGDFRQVA